MKPKISDVPPVPLLSLGTIEVYLAGKRPVGSIINMGGAVYRTRWVAARDMSMFPGGRGVYAHQLTRLFSGTLCTWEIGVWETAYHPLTKEEYEAQLTEEGS